MKQKYIILFILAGLIFVNVLAQRFSLQKPNVAKVTTQKLVLKKDTTPQKPVLAQTQVQSITATGEKQTTIVDENGNLKVIDNDNNDVNTADQTNNPTSNETSPTMTQTPPLPAEQPQPAKTPAATPSPGASAGQKPLFSPSTSAPTTTKSTTTTTTTTPSAPATTQ